MDELRPWRIEFGGHVWTDDDAVTGMLITINEVFGITGWGAASPWTSPVTLAAWVSVLIATSLGDEADLESCVKLVNLAPLNELLGCITEPEVEVESDTEA